MAKKSKQVKTFRKPRERRARGRGKMYDAKAIAIVERRYNAISMRRDGFTIKEISEALGVNEQLIREDLKTVLNDTLIASAETADENRQLQIERLDKLLRTYVPFATDYHKEVRVDGATLQEIIIEVPPDPKYANLILSIEARRAKLLALDVPEVKKMEVTGVREYVGINVDDV